MASQQHTGQAQSRKRETEHNGETEFHTRSNEILRDAIDELRERSDDVRTLVKEYVKEKPIKSLGIALVTGMALALFLKR